MTEEPISLDERRRAKAEQPPPRVVLTCNCGCQSYFVHPDHVECCACGQTTIQAGSIGDWRLEPGQVLPEREDVFSLTETGSLDLGRARTMKKAETALVVIAISDTGGISAHGLITQGPNQLEWMRRRIADITMLVERTHEP